MSSNSDAEKFNWMQGFTVDFSLLNGKSEGAAETTRRRVSDMRGVYKDEVAAESLIEQGNPLVYEFYEMGAPESDAHLAFGTSITYPGKVGKEFFMTKGHFHTILETAEVYYCLSGKGYLLLENPEGDWNLQKLSPGVTVYVPPKYAHRSINTGKSPLVTFFCFRGDAGHDYGSIEAKGFRKLLVEKDGKVDVVDNPKWNQGNDRI